MSTGSDRRPMGRTSLAPRPAGAAPQAAGPVGSGAPRAAAAQTRPGASLAPRPVAGVRASHSTLPPPRPTTPKPGAAQAVDPAIDAMCEAFQQHLPVLVAQPFERRGHLFVRAVGPAAVAAQYVVRFARKAADPTRGPAVEIVFVGANRAPHGRVQELQRMMGARKPSPEDPLRGMRPFFGESEARILVPYEVTIDEPEITSMAAAAKLSEFMLLIDPLIARVK